jgi:hypothetical protein
VGVVKDRINRTSTGETLPQLFIPYTVIGAADRLMVLTHTNPQGIERAVREQVYAVDRIQPVTEVKTFEALIGEKRVLASAIQSPVVHRVCRFRADSRVVRCIWGYFEHRIAAHPRDRNQARAGRDFSAG